MAHQITDEQIRAAILNDLTVPLWPHVGRALGVSRNPVYEAARRGEIETIRIGGRISCPTAPLRKMLGLDEEAR
jgi:hypothetical protein